MRELLVMVLREVRVQLVGLEVPVPRVVQEELHTVVDLLV
jgi:hypothetical protein